MEPPDRTELQAYREELDRAGLSRHRDALVALVRRSVRLVPELAEEQELPHGTSRIGERPDLPATTQWPLSDDAPLSFRCAMIAGRHDSGPAFVSALSAVLA